MPATTFPRPPTATWCRRCRSSRVPSWRWPAGRRRARWPRPPSSSSRACTSPSASTKRRRGPRPPTGGGVDRIDRVGDEKPPAARHAVTRNWSYRRWDGTQRGFEDDVDSLFSELADDLLYHGDPDAALRRLLTSGFRRPDGEQVQGLRELMERLRQRRQEELERGDLGGAFHEIAQELDDVVAEEREGLHALEEEARQSGDARRQEVTDEVVSERNVELDLLPNDLAGKVRGLQQYDFVSSEAREHFEQLMERLREEIAKSFFDQMSEAMTNPDPAQLERVRQMMDALNRMMEQRARGEDLDPSFESFMEQFGDFFPGNPQTLDELLEQFAAQMAAVQAVLDSMTPEQRAQLQALAESLFEDLDLRWQVERLADNLQRAVPGAGWGKRYRFSGTDPMGLADAAAAARRLGEMDQLRSE